MAGQYDRVVQPGETGKIPIKVKTLSASGTLSKSVTVTTNATMNKTSIVLHIKGEVWQPVQVTPRSAAFGRVTSDKAKVGLARKLTIVNNVEGEMKLSGIEVSNPVFKAEVTPIEPGKKYELTVTVVSPLKTGNNSGKIKLTTGIAGTPTLHIPVYAYVTSPVDVTPTKLSLPVTRLQNLTRQFYIRSNVNQPLEITDLKSSSPDLKLKLTDVRKSLTYRLTVDVPATYKPPASGRDTISFKTNNSAVPSITIPITLRRIITKGARNRGIQARTGRMPISVRGRNTASNNKNPAQDKTAQTDGKAKTGENTPPPAAAKKGTQPAGH